jgi:tetratricopeptide (TPR) repeat protein
MPPRIASGADYERCLSLVSSDPTGANAFAEAWEATGGGDGARHCHAAAQISLGKMAAGAEILEKLARSSAAPPLVRAFIYGQATQAWLLAGDAQRAYASATLAVILAPDDVDLLVDRSIAAATMERYLDAIDDLNAALDRDPKRADALVFRAAAWRHDGQLGLAQDDIERALTLEPENPEALLERGILRQRKGDLAGARADWETVLSVAPDGATADLAQQNLSLLDVGPGRRQ